MLPNYKVYNLVIDIFVIEVKCRFQRSIHNFLVFYVLGALKLNCLKKILGWTVGIEEGDTMVELNGGDFILDGLGEIELPPAFPVSNKTR